MFLGRSFPKMIKFLNQVRVCNVWIHITRIIVVGVVMVDLIVTVTVLMMMYVVRVVRITVRLVN